MDEDKSKLDLKHLTRVDRWLTPEEARLVWWNGKPRSQAVIDKYKHKGRSMHMEESMEQKIQAIDETVAHPVVKFLYKQAEANGVTPTDIADQVGVSLQIISQVKNGKRGSIHTIEKIANVVGYTLVAQPKEPNKN